MPKPTAYLETTVVSVLTARPTRDVVQTALQQITREWWDGRSHRFALYVSNQVWTEAQRGDEQAAGRRLALLRGIPQLEINGAIVQLAKALTRVLALPPRKAADAVHIATAAYHRIKFLVTWNCTHFANPVLEARARGVCSSEGYVCPLIATPHQLLEIEL